MNKIVNWLLPLLVIVGGILDSSFDLLLQLINEFGWSPKYVTLIRVAMVVISVVILKLQPPSLKEAKAAKG